MEFGICLNVVDLLREDPRKLDEQLSAISAAGFTYVEATVAAFIDVKEEETIAIKTIIAKNGLLLKRANVLFPGGMKVVGPEKNEERIKEYLTGVFAKLEILGADIIVFGSGGARNRPEDLPYDEAFIQLCETARLITETAAAYGIKVAIEHLNPKECNMLVTIEETIKAVREINHPNCGITFDYYHVDERTNDMYNVIKGKDILFHSHTALPKSRLYPTKEDTAALQSYFTVLKSAGYDGTVSIEGSLHDGKSFEENLTDAYKALTDLSLI